MARYSSFHDHLSLTALSKPAPSAQPQRWPLLSTNSSGGGPPSYSSQVFLICATGLSAEEIVASARERLGNDDATEAAVVADELRKIALLRLRKVLAQ